MNRLLLIRSWLLLVIAPVVGLALTVYLLLAGQLEPWHLPLLVGLIFGPLVAVDSTRQLGVLLKRAGDTLDPSERP